MTKRKPLQWYGDEDDKLGWPDCDRCQREMDHPFLVTACASVGIEKGKSTGQMMREYIDSFHIRGHVGGLPPDFPARTRYPL
jgi:hypothetical protein